MLKKLVLFAFALSAVATTAVGAAADVSLPTQSAEFGKDVAYPTDTVQDGLQITLAKFGNGSNPHFVLIRNPYPFPF